MDLNLRKSYLTREMEEKRLRTDEHSVEREYCFKLE